MANCYLRACFGWFIEFDKLKKWVKEEGNIDIDDEKHDKTVDFLCFIDDWKKIIHSGGNEFILKIQFTSTGNTSLVDDADDYRFMFGICSDGNFDKGYLLKIFAFMETELYQKEVEAFAHRLIDEPFDDPASISDAGSYD